MLDVILGIGVCDYNFRDRKKEGGVTVRYIMKELKEEMKRCLEFALK